MATLLPGVRKSIRFKTTEQKNPTKTMLDFLNGLQNVRRQIAIRNSKQLWVTCLYLLASFVSASRGKKI